MRRCCHAEVRGSCLPMPRLLRRPGPSRPGTPPPAECAAQPSRRTTAPLGRRPGVQEAGPRRRHAGLPHHRPPRRYRPPWPGGTRRRPARPAYRPRPQAGGGATAGKKKAPEALEDLKELAEPVTGGDPMSDAKYVRTSLQTLSDGLRELGHLACPTTVAELLRHLGYNLRVNIKRFTGPPHPDRDVQFCYLSGLIDEF